MGPPTFSRDSPHHRIWKAKRHRTQCLEKAPGLTGLCKAAQESSPRCQSRPTLRTSAGEGNEELAVRKGPDTTSGSSASPVRLFHQLLSSLPSPSAHSLSPRLTTARCLAVKEEQKTADAGYLRSFPAMEPPPWTSLLSGDWKITLVPTSCLIVYC